MGSQLLLESLLGSHGHSQVKPRANLSMASSPHIAQQSASWLEYVFQTSLLRCLSMLQFSSWVLIVTHINTRPTLQLQATCYIRWKVRVATTVDRMANKSCRANGTGNKHQQAGNRWPRTSIIQTIIVIIMINSISISIRLSECFDNLILVWRAWRNCQSG